jgi:hypothetical protein
VEVVCSTHCVPYPGGVMHGRDMDALLSVHVRHSVFFYDDKVHRVKRWWSARHLARYTGEPAGSGLTGREWTNWRFHLLALAG